MSFSLLGVCVCVCISLIRWLHCLQRLRQYRFEISIQMLRTSKVTIPLKESRIYIYGWKHLYFSAFSYIIPHSLLMHICHLQRMLFLNAAFTFSSEYISICISTPINYVTHHLFVLIFSKIDCGRTLCNVSNAIYPIAVIREKRKRVAEILIFFLALVKLVLSSLSFPYVCVYGFLERDFLGRNWSLMYISCRK